MQRLKFNPFDFESAYARDGNDPIPVDKAAAAAADSALQDWEEGVAGHDHTYACGFRRREEERLEEADST